MPASRATPRRAGSRACRGCSLLHEPQLVVIELGGNDGLRGQPVATLRDNLAKMIELSQRSGADVVLAGIQIPPNYGPTYTRALAAVYPELAAAFEPARGVPARGRSVAPRAHAAGRHSSERRGQKSRVRQRWRVLGPLLKPRNVAKPWLKRTRRACRQRSIPIAIRRWSALLEASFARFPAQPAFTNLDTTITFARRRAALSRVRGVSAIVAGSETGRSRRGHGAELVLTVVAWRPTGIRWP